MSSACEILSSETARFIDYLLADTKVRSKIVDQRSFVDALDKVLKSDASLSNIPAEIKRKGESLELCGIDIYNDPSIQNIIKRNVGSKRREINKRVRMEKPTWTRTQRMKEANRRMQIFISSSSQKIKQTKQVTIAEATRPVKVKEYDREGKKVSGYRKTEYKTLTMQEQMLLENGIRKGKKPSEVAKDYLQAGLGFRTGISLKRHYYRLKDKLKI